MIHFRGELDAQGRPVYAAADLSNGTTGTGAVVLATSPTIATPTLTEPVIASFTSATHTHESQAQGNRLSPASWMGGPSAELKALFDLAFWEGRSETGGYAHNASVGTITDTSAAASNWTQGSGGAQGVWKSTGASGAMLPNGHPFLRLDGSDDVYSRAARIGANAMTVIAVLRNHGGGTGYRFIFNTDNHALAKSMTSNVWGFYSAGDRGYGTALGSGWGIYVWRVNGTGYNNFDMMGDGLMLNTAPAGASESRTICYLGAYNGPSFFADVDIAAFAIASSALSAANVAAATAYFRNVYFTP